MASEASSLFSTMSSTITAVSAISNLTTSNEEQHKLFILNAIDKLRERKARPDVERITALVYRQHKLQRNTTASILEKLVDHGAVVRVEYKGSVSYRNAAKWKRSSLSGSVLNSSVTSQRLGDALRSLAYEREPEMQEIGFTFEDIEEALLRQPMPPSLERSHSQVSVSEEGDSDSSGSGGSHEDELRGDNLRRALERESTAGSFVRLPGDRFALDNDGSRRQSIAEHMAKRPSKVFISSKKEPTANPIINILVKDTNMSTLSTCSAPGLKLIAPAPSAENMRTPLTTTNSSGFNFANLPAGLPAILPPPPPHLPRSSQPFSSSSATFSYPNQTDSDSCHDLLHCTAKNKFQSLIRSSLDKPATPVARYAAIAPFDSQHTHQNVPTLPSLSNQLQAQSVPNFNHSQSSPVTSSLSSHILQDKASSSTVHNNGIAPKRGRPLGSKKKALVRSEAEVLTDAISSKRAKLNADINPPSVQASDPQVVNNRCDFCFSSSSPLLCCISCSAKAHPTCMNYNSELALRVQTSPWQCSECKICCICEDVGDPELMLICDGCDKGYHLSCHLPAVCDKPSADMKWVCSHCQTSPGFVYDAKDFQLTNSSSATLVKEEPDVTNWGVEETASWLHDQGFQSAANIFRDQEVDGASLLLMKRMDVLTGLGLKLGPAVKIYDKIRRLQAHGRMLLACD